MSFAAVIFCSVSTFASRYLPERFVHRQNTIISNERIVQINGLYLFSVSLKILMGEYFIHIGQLCRVANIPLFYFPIPGGMTAVITHNYSIIRCWNIHMPSCACVVVYINCI